MSSKEMIEAVVNGKSPEDVLAESINPISEDMKKDIKKVLDLAKVKYLLIGDGPGETKGVDVSSGKVSVMFKKDSAEIYVNKSSTLNKIKKSLENTNLKFREKLTNNYFVVMVKK